MKIYQKTQEKATVLEFFKCYNERNIDAMLKAFSPGAPVVFIPFREGGVGEVHVLGKVIWESLLEAFPDIRHTIHKIKTDPYGYLICEVNVQGTQAKDFPGIRSRGLRFEADHIFIFHFDEQRQVDQMSVNWDHYEWRRELGAF